METKTNKVHRGRSRNRSSHLQSTEELLFMYFFSLGCCVSSLKGPHDRMMKRFILTPVCPTSAQVTRDFVGKVCENELQCENLTFV